MITTPEYDNVGTESDASASRVANTYKVPNNSRTNVHYNMLLLSGCSGTYSRAPHSNCYEYRE